MRRPHLPILLVLVALAALALPALAAADGRDVIRDCADDGTIDGNYSEEELREAEDDLPSDIDEYTDCREAIRAEIGRKRDGDGGGTGNGPGGSGGAGGGAADPSLVTPDGAVAGSREDLAALEEIGRASERGEAPSLRIGDTTVTPGDAGGGNVLGVSQASNDLPAPILAVLSLLVLLLLATTAALATNRRRALAGGAGNVLRSVRRVSPARFRRR
jgi:hypothetical protein